MAVLLALVSLIQLTSAQTINPDEPWNWPEEYVLEQVNQVRAGRDLTPDSWPNGARVAVLRDARAPGHLEGRLEGRDPPSAGHVLGR